MSGTVTFHALILDANGSAIGSHAYAEQPSTLPANEIACTAAQAANPGQWAVQNGVLVAATATLAEQAQAMLEAGIQIICSSDATLSGTYACDPVTVGRAGNLLAAIAANIPLPSPTIQWADINGFPHSFNVTEFKNLTAAILDFEMQLFPLANGAPGSLPSQPVTIA
jgi:hypothetical protein